MYLSDLIQDTGLRTAHHALQEYVKRHETEYTEKYVENFNSIIRYQVYGKLSTIVGFITEPMKVNQLDEVEGYLWLRQPWEFTTLNGSNDGWDVVIHVGLFAKDKELWLLIIQRNANHTYYIQHLRLDKDKVPTDFTAHTLKVNDLNRLFPSEGTRYFTNHQHYCQCWTKRLKDNISFDTVTSVGTVTEAIILDRPPIEETTNGVDSI